MFALGVLFPLFMNQTQLFWSAEPALSFTTTGCVSSNACGLCVLVEKYPFFVPHETFLRMKRSSAADDAG